MLEDTVMEDADVKKLQASYRGLTLRPYSGDTGVTLSLEYAYESFADGMPMREIAEALTETYRKAMAEKPDVRFIENPEDYSVIRERLFLQVVHAEKNREMLRTIPHKRMENLAVVCRYDISEAADQSAAVLFTEELLEYYSVTEEKLFRDAEAAAPRNYPYKLESMENMIGALMGTSEPVEIMVPPVLVATSDPGVMGASVIAYPGFLKAAAEAIGGSFYILPSSIHEVLLLKDNGLQDENELEEMVQSVNETSVDPSERLSDSVYYYESSGDCFRMCRSADRNPA